MHILNFFAYLLSNDPSYSPCVSLREIDAALSLNTSSNIQLGDFLLKQKFPPISSDMVKKFKGVKPFAVIERFEEMSYEKYKSLSLSSQVIKEGLARPSQKYFVGRLTEELDKQFFF